jgi:hypothetical protein
MQAMVNEIHAPQDNLSFDEWVEAERMMEEMDEAMNVKN